MENHLVTTNRNLLVLIRSSESEKELMNMINNEEKNIRDQLEKEKGMKEVELIDEKNWDKSQVVFYEIRKLFASMNKLLTSRDYLEEDLDENKEKMGEDPNEPINPIDFVQRFEANIDKNPKLNSYLSMIKQYDSTNKEKIIRLTLESNPALFTEINKQQKEITIIKVVYSCVFVACVGGRIWQYDKSLKERGTLYEDSSYKDKGQVTAMDISSDCNWIIAGYQYGYVILWECSNQKAKKILTNGLLQSKETIISVKYLTSPFNNTHHFISSDSSGGMRKYEITHSSFSARAEVELLYQGFSPFSLMLPLIISQKKFEKYTKLKEIRNTMIVIGSRDLIKLLYIEIDTNDNMRGEDILNINRDLGKYNQDAYFKISSLSEKGNKEILLFISSQAVIYVYSLIVNNNYIQGTLFEGSYCFKENVYRILLYQLQNLYFLDESYTMHVIDIKVFKNSRRGIEESMYDSDDFNENIDVVQSLNIPDVKQKKQDSKELLNLNHISARNKDLFILGSHTLHKLTFMNWKMILKDFLNKNHLIGYFSYALYYYNKKRKEGSEEDTFTRKNKLGFIMDELFQYLSHLETKAKNIDSTELACMLIEFLTDTQSDSEIIYYINRLYNWKKEFKGLALLVFEVFILNNKCTQLSSLSKKHTDELFWIFYDLRHFALSQVICYLNFDIIINDFYYSKCKDRRLITAMIIIVMNSSNLDYFSLIDYIFQLFQGAIELPKEKLISYQNCDMAMNVIELENSKQYIGHKLLWLIDMCIEGYKFPSKEPISSEQYLSLIPCIFFWLITTNIINSFIEFDSFSLFQVLTHLFMNDRSYEILYDINKESSVQMLTLITSIADSFKESNFYVKQDLNEFLVTIAEKIKFPRETKLQILSELFLYYKLIEEKENKYIEDKFKCHSQLLQSNSPRLSLISKKMIAMLNSIKDLTKKEIRNLFILSEKSQYLLVRIYLEHLEEKYLTCIDLYLQSDKKGKDSEVFQYIDMVLGMLSKSSDEDEKCERMLNQVQHGVIERVKKLAELSFEKFVELTQKWFFIERENVIRQLANCPLLQLKYIETLINPNLQRSSQYNYQLSIDSHEVSQYLLMQIELYIRLGKKKMVLKILKDRTEYPQNECLNLCKKHNITEASIYLYKIMGDNFSALQVSLNEMKQSFISIEKYLDRADSETQLDVLLDEFKRTIYQSESICDDWRDSEESFDFQKLWLTLLSELYTLMNKFKSEDSSPSRERVCLCLSSQIVKILEKMCGVVPINLILQNVTANCKDVTFKEFSALLNKILVSVRKMNKIFYSFKDLMSHSISHKVNYFQRLNIKGCGYLIEKCDVCHFFFKKADEECFSCFKCGHITHTYCVSFNKDVKVCKICKQNEEIETAPEEKEVKKSNRPKRKSFVSDLKLIPDKDIENQMRMKRIETKKLQTLKSMDKEYSNKFIYLK